MAVLLCVRCAWVVVRFGGVGCTGGVSVGGIGVSEATKPVGGSSPGGQGSERLVVYPAGGWVGAYARTPLNSPSKNTWYPCTRVRRCRIAAGLGGTSVQR